MDSRNGSGSPTETPTTSFVGVTESMGLKGINSGVAAWGDFDNDGYLDLFAFSGHNGKLFRNLNSKEFKEVPFPELPMPVSLGAAWGDFDGDGFRPVRR